MGPGFLSCCVPYTCRATGVPGAFLASTKASVNGIDSHSQRRAFLIPDILQVLDNRAALHAREAGNPKERVCAPGWGSHSNPIQSHLLSSSVDWEGSASETLWAARVPALVQVRE